MKITKKRLYAWLMAAVMTASLLPTAVFAEYEGTDFSSAVEAEEASESPEKSIPENTAEGEEADGGAAEGMALLLSRGEADALAVYADGTYTGTGTGFENGTIQLDVTIEDGRITEIRTVKKERQSYWEKCDVESLFDEIRQAQSADVDAVSGATLSSDGVRQAVKDALEQAAKAAGHPSETVFSSGSGAEDDPYILETEAQLRALAASVNSGTDYAGEYIELADDIALSDETWTPIGTAEGQTVLNGFSGILNGNGHVISGMTIGTREAPASLTNAGLFGALSTGAEIYDLGVTDVSIYNDCAGEERLPRPVVGVLASYANGGKEIRRGSTVVIDGCWATGTVVNENAVTDRYAYVGGLVGTAGYGPLIANCWTDVDIHAAGSGGANYAGGIIGMDSNSGMTANCASFGDVTVDLGGQKMLPYWGAGGIAGENSSGIFNCYAAGGTALSEDLPEEDYPIGIGAISGGFSAEESYWGLYSAYGCIFNKEARQTVGGKSLGEPVAVSLSAMGYYGANELTEDDISEQEYCFGKPADFFGTQALADAMNAGLSQDKIDEADGSLNTEPSDYISLLENGLKTWTLTGGRVLPTGEAKEESPFEGGKGTESEPYKIKTAEQFADFAASVTEDNSYAGQFIRLDRNITLNGDWTPIDGFGGAFDGNGHTISHVYVGTGDTRAAAPAAAGLFGTVLDNTRISNLRLTDVMVNSSARGMDRSYAGALVGRAGDSVVIDHCAVTGGCVAAEHTGRAYAYGGGLVGYMGMESILANSSADVTVTAASKSAMAMAGGITAGNGAKSLIMNCVALGDVSSSGKPLSGSVFGGGLAGFPTGVVYNCYAGGSVTVTNTSEYEGSPRAGALIGHLFSGTAAMKLYYSAAAVLTENGTTLETAANGDVEGVEKDLTGVPAETDLTVVAALLNKGLSQASLNAADAYLASAAGQMSGGFTSGEFTAMYQRVPARYALSTDDDGRLTVSDTVYEEPEGPDFFAGGTGTKEDPYQIETENQLREFAASCGEENDYAGEYIVLTRDIALTEEWQPVGWQTDGAYFFCGSFDGQGHTISHLTVGTKEAPAADSEYGYQVYYGLFAGLGDLAVVRNVKLEGVSIHLTSEASLMAGSIAGYSLNAGIDNCSAAGSISVKTTNPTQELFSANCFAGGIVGNISGGYLINSWTDMELRAEGRTANAEAGGLAGLSAYGLIANCYALGDVSGETDRTVHDGGMAYVSGLVGCQAARMFNCYTMGSLNSASYSKMVGFLAGMSTGISETSYNYYSTDADQLIDGLEVNPKTSFGVMVSGGTGEDGDSFPGCLAKGNEGKSAGEMTVQAFADQLNGNFSAFPADVEKELPEGTALKKWVVRDGIVTVGTEAAEVTYVPVERPEVKTVYADGVYYGRDFLDDGYEQAIILRAVVRDGVITEITAVELPDALNRDELDAVCRQALSDQKVPAAQSGDSDTQRAAKSTLEILFAKAESGDTSGYGEADPSIFAGGTGTKADPYQISTAAQLRAFAAAVNIDESFEGKYIVLTCDIDLKGIDWTPAGVGGNVFTGTFDGRNHVIRNMTIGTAEQPSRHMMAGLFTNLDGAVVKNLGLADAFICLKRTDDKRSYAGLVAALVKPGYTGRAAVITNCTVSGTIYNAANSWSYCGGIAGSTLYNLIENCTATVQILGSSVSASVAAGGIVGVDGFTGMRNCSAFGRIEADGSVNAVSIGGIAGMKSGPGLNCYADVALISKAATIDVGGIAGRNTGTGILDTNYFNAEAEQKVGPRTITPAQGLGMNVDYGEWIGSVERMESRTAAQMKEAAFCEQLNANRASEALNKIWNDYVQDDEILSSTLEAPEMDTWVLRDGVAVLKNAPVLNPASSGAAARIGETEYETLQAAVDAAGSGAVISVLRSGLSAVVSGNKTFTLKLAADVTEPTLEAAAGYRLTRSGSTYTVSAKSSGGSSGGSSDSSSGSSAVSVPSVKNGEVTVSPGSAEKGATVTITVTPDEGYALGTITVKDAGGSKIKLTDKGGGKYTFTMPGSKVTVSAEFTRIQTAAAFADVPAGAYYAEAVEWAVRNGITNGKADGLFGSHDPCTRGQIVTFLWRAAGSPAPKGTAAVPADVAPGSYCFNAVAWALENGITMGLADGTFGVNQPCTRGQSVTFLYRALGTAPTAASGFADVAADSFCAEAVAWAVENGVTNGTSAVTFSPDDSCTRAQIAVFLYRAMK